MLHVKNLHLTQTIKDSMNLIKMVNQALPDFQYISILESNICVFFHKKKRNLKFAKWEIRIIKRNLVSFDASRINRVYVKDQNKVISVQKSINL